MRTLLKIVLVGLGIGLLFHAADYTVSSVSVVWGVVEMWIGLTLMFLANVVHNCCGHCYGHSNEIPFLKSSTL